MLPKIAPHPQFWDYHQICQGALYSNLKLKVWGFLFWCGLHLQQNETINLMRIEMVVTLQTASTGHIFKNAPTLKNILPACRKVPVGGKASPQATPCCASFLRARSFLNGRVFKTVQGQVEPPQDLITPLLHTWTSLVTILAWNWVCTEKYHSPAMALLMKIGEKDGLSLIFKPLHNSSPTWYPQTKQTEQKKREDHNPRQHTRIRTPWDGQMIPACQQTSACVVVAHSHGSHLLLARSVCAASVPLRY